MRVVIIKGVASTFEFDQLATVLFLAVPLGKFRHYLDRNEPVILAMVKHARGKACLWYVLRGAEVFCFLLRNEALSAYPLTGSIDNRTK